MVKQEKKLWLAMDKLRGFASFDIELFDFIASVGLLAKQQPESFAEVYKCPKSKQRDLLISALADLAASETAELFNTIFIKQYSPELIQTVVYMVSEVDDFGQLAESLSQWISETGGKRNGEITTSPSLVKLFAALFANEAAGSVFDGAAGLANLAVGVSHKELRLAEINRSTWSLGVKLLKLKDVTASYQCHNSLVAKVPSQMADLVVMQPPWGLRLQPRELKDLAKAPYIAVDKGKKIPTSAGDALWIQLALFHANDSGKVLMALPPGFFFRGGYDAKCREYLLEHDLVEAVVALPERLNSFSSISTVLLLLNKAKPKEQEGIVRFVDATHMGSGKTQRIFSADEITSIVDFVRGSLSVSKYAKEVLLPQIYKNDNNLNVRNYTYEEVVLEVPNLAEELAKLEKAKRTFQEAQSRLDELLSLAALQGKI